MTTRSRAHNSKQRQRQIKRLRERDGDNCALCGAPMYFPEVRKPCRALATLDHIVPCFEGGSNRLDNLRLTHLRCNTLRRGQESNLPDPQGNPQHRFYVGGRRYRETRYWAMFKADYEQSSKQGG